MARIKAGGGGPLLSQGEVIERVIFFRVTKFGEVFFVDEILIFRHSAHEISYFEQSRSSVLSRGSVGDVETQKSRGDDEREYHRRQRSEGRRHPFNI